MFKIGCHLSIAGGYLAAAETAKKIGANVFQYFSRNPRGGTAKAVDINDIQSAKNFCANNGIGDLLTHAPYTLNPSSIDPKVRAFAKLCIKGDIKTLELFDNGMYNFHPGSHTGQGSDEGISQICELLNEVIEKDQKTVMLLEAMSGKGSEIGGTFEELAQIIDKVNYPSKMGVLIDTCHIYSSGYDIVNDLDGVLEKFERTVGLKYLKAIHLNDSMTPFNSKKDRHELIGKGSIGLDAIARIINHKYLKNLPFYLETPNEVDGYAEEIKLLKSLYNS